MSTHTRIPPTEYNRIVQTNSCPETIVALLNEAEALYSDKPKHWNAKRQYPYWKVCPTCNKPFAVMDWREYQSKNHCSRVCANKTIGRKRKGQRQFDKRKGQVIVCPVCGREVYKPRSWLAKVKVPTCSRHCNGVLRHKALAPHASKGRAAWTEQSLASYREKMSGPNNPAWKGGVTYFRKHGNYAPIKYVRCPEAFLAMARKDGYVMEHRLLVAQAMGRCLIRSEVVHHVNHDPQDNRLENLLLFVSNTAHKRYEATGKPAPLWQP